MKRTIPLLITGIVGLVLVIAYFIPHPPFDGLREDFSIFFDIIASVAFILGGGNLIKMHGNRVSRREKGWGYSLVTVLGFIGTICDSIRTHAESEATAGCGVVNANRTGFRSSRWRRRNSKSGTQSTHSAPHQWPAPGW